MQDQIIQIFILNYKKEVIYISLGYILFQRY